jgi:RNA polymerase sigma-70 factor (ECF subfamily)
LESLSPEELVILCQRTLPEDTRAFEVLVAQYKQRVFSTAFRLMGNREEAEDQAQEVFLKVYRGIKQLDDPATLTTWIYRITTNTCFDALSSRDRRPATKPLGEAGNSDEPEPIIYADSRTLTPEEAVMRKDLRRCLEKAISGLDPVDRGIIVLRDIEDRPYQEIAESLAIGLSAAKMRIHRARLTFQKIFARVCPGMWGKGLTTDAAASR